MARGAGWGRLGCLKTSRYPYCPVVGSQNAANRLESNMLRDTWAQTISICWLLLSRYHACKRHGEIAWKIVGTPPPGSRDAGISISPSRVAELTQAMYERSLTLPNDSQRRSIDEQRQVYKLPD